MMMMKNWKKIELCCRHGGSCSFMPVPANFGWRDNEELASLAFQVSVQRGRGVYFSILLSNKIKERNSLAAATFTP
jgi:hypothetical protein